MYDCTCTNYDYCQPGIRVHAQPYHLYEYVEQLYAPTHVQYNRGVNRAEISGPARKFFFFGSARPGPARNQCIIKFVLYNCFEILQKNQFNYIKLPSHFPLFQILYCPSTTVMYNVQLHQQRLKNFGSRGEHRTKFHT